MEYGYLTKILALWVFVVPTSVLMKKFFMKTIFKELPGGGEHLAFSATIIILSLFITLMINRIL
jgi:hypothetical protein